MNLFFFFMNGPQTDRAHLHSLSLVRSCVQKAVGLLRDADNMPSRSMQRMHILLSLLKSQQEHLGGKRAKLFESSFTVGLLKADESTSQSCRAAKLCYVLECASKVRF